MAHEDLGTKIEGHKPGCVTRHVGTYYKDNVCSHRWQAAKKAVANPSRYGVNSKPVLWAWGPGKAKKLKRWTQQGKATGHTAKPNNKTEFTLEPFATMMKPWLNNAHHIIPRSTIAGVWDDVSKQATPRVVRCFNSMVKFALAEAYNLNGEPNMIMLPLDSKDAKRLGLPRHLRGGQRDHADYSGVVRDQVEAKLEPLYSDLVNCLKVKKHITKTAEPKVRDELEGISNTVYDQILALGAADRAAGKAAETLDEMSSRISL